MGPVYGFVFVNEAAVTMVSRNEMSDTSKMQAWKRLAVARGKFLEQLLKNDDYKDIPFDEFDVEMARIKHAKEELKKMGEKV